MVLGADSPQVPLRSSGMMGLPECRRNAEAALISTPEPVAPPSASCSILRLYSGVQMARIASARSISSIMKLSMLWFSSRHSSRRASTPTLRNSPARLCTQSLCSGESQEYEIKIRGLSLCGFTSLSVGFSCIIS